jgi:hypothetical protein
MQLESRWPAPFCPADDREDAFFEGPGGRSWTRVDSRTDQADLDRTAAVARRIEPARSLSKPNRRRRWVAAVMSLVIDHVIEGFALSATTLHPEFFLLASEQARNAKRGNAGSHRGQNPIHLSYAGQGPAAPPVP